jgi:hypothetical protein
MGHDYAVPDAHFFVVSNWAFWVNFDLTPYPALLAHRQRVGSRFAVVAALKAEGLVPWPAAPRLAETAQPENGGWPLKRIRIVTAQVSRNMSLRRRGGKWREARCAADHSIGPLRHLTRWASALRPTSISCLSRFVPALTRAGALCEGDQPSTSNSFDHRDV